MNIKETLYVKNRAGWRKWLKRHYNKRKEIWLIYYKKHTGKPVIPYEHAVEEALCFGWIDSTVKKIDDEKYVQRYTPRNDKSVWSDYNIKRVKKMIKQGKMTEAGLEKYKNAFKRKDKRIIEQSKILKVPSYINKRISKNKIAWENFRKLAPSYKKIYVWWIDSAKKEETREKRFKKAIDYLMQNKRMF